MTVVDEEGRAERQIRPLAEGVIRWLMCSLTSVRKILGSTNLPRGRLLCRILLNLAKRGQEESISKRREKATRQLGPQTWIIHGHGRFNIRGMQQAGEEDCAHVEYELLRFVVPEREAISTWAHRTLETVLLFVVTGGTCHIRAVPVNPRKESSHTYQTLCICRVDTVLCDAASVFVD